MYKQFLLLGLVGLAAGACTANPQTNRQIECAAGVLGGATVGGVVGNQIGGGQGKRIATAVGTGAGAVAGAQLPACK